MSLPLTLCTRRLRNLLKLKMRRRCGTGMVDSQLFSSTLSLSKQTRLILMMASMSNSYSPHQQLVELLLLHTIRRSVKQRSMMWSFRAHESAVFSQMPTASHQATWMPPLVMCRPMPRSVRLIWPASSINRKNSSSMSKMRLRSLYLMPQMPSKISSPPSTPSHSPATPASMNSRTPGHTISQHSRIFQRSRTT